MRFDYSNRSQAQGRVKCNRCSRPFLGIDEMQPWDMHEVFCGCPDTQSKRAEEIEAAAYDIYPYEQSFRHEDIQELLRDGFKEGVAWADAHPSPEVLALVEALAKISLGHQYGCGTNDGLRCTCVASIANEALANFNKARGVK